MRLLALIVSCLLPPITLMLHAGFAQELQSPVHTAFYVDSLSGDDTSSGQSPQYPWKTLSRVNAETFAAGDAIYLKAGDSWNDEQLFPQGSGAPGAPIIVSRYGSGSDPVINTNMAFESSVLLMDQQYWEISHLEITNSSEFSPASVDGHYLGVCFTLTRAHEILSHIFVTDCFIHDVDGDPDYQDVANDKTSGGIGARVRCTDAVHAGHFDNIRIVNNRIQNVTRTGIALFSNSVLRNQQNPAVLGFSTNIYIAGNTIDLAAGDGVLLTYVNQALVEHNVVTHAVDRCTYPCDGVSGSYLRDVVYQYNECSYITKAWGHGEAWEFGDDNRNVTYQYNYSHDNKRGWMLMMPNADDSSLVCRYNISANESTGVAWETPTSSLMYNNDFYNDYCDIADGLPEYALGFAKSYNNLFYNCKDIEFGDLNAVHDYNAYFNSGGDHAEVHAIIADPELVGPLTNTSPDGEQSCGIFRLSTNTPLHSAGTLCPRSLVPNFFGDAPAKTPNIGAD